MGFWPVVKHLIHEADIIVLVADARMPDISLNNELLEKVDMAGKELVVVFNKIDLISSEKLKNLKREYSEAFFVSGIKNIGVGYLKRGLQIIAKRIKIQDPKIGVVGYPNIGKSAIINALAHRRRAEVGDQPGTTKGVQWVNAGALRILDSPGVIPFDDKNSKLALLGAKSPHKMTHPDKAAKDILGLFAIKNPHILKDYYKLHNVSQNVDELFDSIGIKRGYLLKGGILDEHRTAISIIRDWQRGKLRL